MIYNYAYPEQFDNQPFHNVTVQDSNEEAPSTAYNLTIRDIPEITKITKSMSEIVCKKINRNDPISCQLFEITQSVFQFFKNSFRLKKINWNGPFPSVYIEKDPLTDAWICQNTIHDEDQCPILFRDISFSLPAMIAHKYMRALIKALSPLSYVGHQGALIEHLCAVMTIACEQMNQRKPLTDWKIIGMDFSRFAHIRNYKPNSENIFDRSIHEYNSRIPNHVFYLVVKNTNLVSYGWIANIWFTAFRKLLGKATFFTFARQTVLAGRRIDKEFELSEELHFAKTIEDAWHQVGVKIKFYSEKKIPEINLVSSKAEK